MPPTPIGPNDTIAVRGRHMYRQSDGARFFMKGIAFPDPPADDDDSSGQPHAATSGYNATGWIAILRQLRSHHLEYNTVRIYRMDPKINYAEFFDEAASLGVYVIVPLTSAAGGGVLDRTSSAPKCYNRHLYRYGVSCLKNYLRYPNVLGGLLANEVMNSKASWSAAPCIKAYARDLKIYMARQREIDDGSIGRSLPLFYAAQDSGIGAGVNPAKAMAMTAGYLTCVPGDDIKAEVSVASADNSPRNDDGSPPTDSIDVFGVNIESWCSTNSTFHYNDDGTVGSYYTLWKGMHDDETAPVPLVFTEMGCSHLQFNKENPKYRTAEGTRDWAQVPIALRGGNMSDTWSGFSAYAYYGNPEFNMFKGGPWNGGDPLTPTDDFYNFRDQLRAVADAEEAEAAAAAVEGTGGGVTAGRTSSQRAREEVGDTVLKFPRCEDVEEELRSCCDVVLHDFQRVRSYAVHRPVLPVVVALVLALLVVAAGLVKYFRRRTSSSSSSPPHLIEVPTNVDVKYQSIN